MAWIRSEKGSWALPLRHERITSFETPLTKAAFQLRLVCRHLKERPISLWDSEYGCAKFVQLTADINVDKLMRLRPNRCVFGAPPPYQGTGIPYKHGHKMKLSDSRTWGIPVELIKINDPNWGQIENQKWSQFHFYHSAEHPMEIILVQRKGKGLSKKAAKPMWLAWIGTEKLSLKSLWQFYLRRFAIEDWNRFIKQRLHWTKAKLGTTEKGQRWRDLMTILTGQLWLAREIIEDNPLPWQKPQPKEKLTLLMGCPKRPWSFSRDRHSSPYAKTSRKVPWLGERKKKEEKTSLSSGQKNSNSPEKREKRSRLKQIFKLSPSF